MATMKDFIQDRGNQWIVFICMQVYFANLLFVRYRNNPVLFRRLNPVSLATVAFLILTILIVSKWSISTQVLTLLAGFLLGQTVSFWNSAESRVSLCFLTMLTIVLGLSTIFNHSFSHYEYKGNIRWSGPLNNPNIFGLLTGVGMMLVFGYLFMAFENNSGHKRCLNAFYIFLCTLGVILFGRALLNSYSRGAWSGASIGLLYLGIYKLRLQNSKLHRWSPRNVVSLIVILLSVGVLVFWRILYFDYAAVISRALSIANRSDFSQANRIAAWEGALQIIDDNPYQGIGGNMTLPLYQQYYLSHKLSDSSAIQTNDILIFATMFGIPALFCFLTYFYTVFYKDFARNSNLTEQIVIAVDNYGDASNSLKSGHWLAPSCRAGALVLFVGFWFDGGLFTFPLGYLFWLFLELGRPELP